VKKRTLVASVLLFILSIVVVAGGSAFFWDKKTPVLTPNNDRLEIPLSEIDNGQAHHYNVQAADGTMVTFFVIKSSDGVFRAAIDSCDVCFTSGKGYFQDNDFMVCENCGQKFASNKINVIKGGCNPAPLNRKVVGPNLVIAMTDIDANSWYCKYKR